MRLREEVVTSGEGSVGRVEGVRCLEGGCETDGLAMGVYMDEITETLVEREGLLLLGVIM